MARNSSPGLDTVLSGSFSRYLSVDILHGTDRVAQDVRVESWSLTGDLGRDPKTTGELRFVHQSVRGESWVPEGTRGILSPFKATLVLTEVIIAGGFEERVQLGLFDVVAVPHAEDVLATVGYAPRSAEVTDAIVPSDVLVPSNDLVPGDGGIYLSPGRDGFEIVVASIVDVEVESLDARVLGASFRSPRTSLTSAWDEWQAVGLLPVLREDDDADLPSGVWPAEQGSRLDAVQECARRLGGVPVVNSFGQWTLADDTTDTVTLSLGEFGTVVDVSSELTLDGFYNVVVGDYEAEDGTPIRSEWVASGNLSPAVMGREFVRFHKSDMVRTKASADAATASVGALYSSQEVDVVVTCVYNPLVELGDHCVVDGASVEGSVQRVDESDSETMTVTVRVRRELS
jgi:hypothetical protein